jgi:hypothetical protein
MSRHDPRVTLRQILDHAQRAQELCAQNTLPQILADWQKRAAFARVIAPRTAPRPMAREKTFKSDGDESR